MRDPHDDGSFEREVRDAFRALVAEALPAAAAARGWPVGSAPAFERLLLDHVRCAAPARPYADRFDPACAPLLDLVLAVEAGARLLEGALCVAELNRRSLALRAARPPLPCASATRHPDLALCEREVSALMRRAVSVAARRRRGRRPPG